MQLLQPMHFSLSMTTMPSSSRMVVAPCGHTATHGGFSHIMHSMGRMVRTAFG